MAPRGAGAGILRPAPIALRRPADQSPLVVVSAGGAVYERFKKPFFEPFTTETDVEIVQVAAFASEQFARVRAMTSVGDVEWDVVTVQPDSFLRERDYRGPLDCSRFPDGREFGVEGTRGEFGMLRTVVDGRQEVDAHCGNVRGSGVPISAELGQLLLGEHRAAAADTTVFRSVGMAVEDIYAAELVLTRIDA